jgi:hypothetical protein
MDRAGKVQPQRLDAREQPGDRGAGEAEAVVRRRRPEVVDPDDLDPVGEPGDQTGVDLDVQDHPLHDAVSRLDGVDDVPDEIPEPRMVHVPALIRRPSPD